MGSPRNPPRTLAPDSMMSEARLPRHWELSERSGPPSTEFLCAASANVNVSVLYQSFDTASRPRPTSIVLAAGAARQSGLGEMNAKTTHDLVLLAALSLLCATVAWV
jgi:hypothetical protein